MSIEQKERYYKEYPDALDPDKIGTAADPNPLLFNFWEDIGHHINSKPWADGNVPMIGIGHTHPNVSESYGNYSLPDLVGALE